MYRNTSVDGHKAKDIVTPDGATAAPQLILYIIYMLVNDQNERSIAVNGDVRGRSMLPCHSERSRQIIESLITNGENNVYTIEKRGLRKMIYQTPWRAEGRVAGLVEFSLEIPETMPHYVRG